MSRGGMEAAQTGPRPSDIAGAATLLTRLPLPVDHARAGARAALAVWAYPVVGGLIGAVAGGVVALLTALGAPALAAAAIALLIGLALTGALHEDGFADMADGLGGRDPARRLEIMRDSRIGAFGAAALIAALLAKASLLAHVAEGAPGLTTIAMAAAAGAASRAPLGAAMRWLAPARREGLAAGVGRPPTWAALLALGLGALALAGFGWSGGAALAAGLASAAMVAAMARRAFGGVTGDVLGAMQVAAEIAALTALAAGIGP